MAATVHERDSAGSMPYVGWVWCWFSPLLREDILTPCSPVFPSRQNPTFPNSSSTRNQDEELLSGSATFKPLFIYLFIHSFIYLKSILITSFKQEQITWREQVSSMRSFQGVSSSFGEKSYKPVTKTYIHSSKWHFWFIVCDLKGIKILVFRLAFWRLRQSRTTTKNNPTNFVRVNLSLEFLPKLKTHQFGCMYFLHKL